MVHLHLQAYSKAFNERGDPQLSTMTRTTELTPLYRSSTVRECETIWISHYKLNSTDLMDHAVTRLWETMTPFLPPARSRVRFLIGPGNNGGDGLGLARLFWLNGFHVEIFTLDEEAKTQEWKDQLQKLKNHQIKEPPIAKLSFNKLSSFTWRTRVGHVWDPHGEPIQGPSGPLTGDVTEAPLVIDALFGAGFKGSLPQVVQELVDELTIFQAGGRAPEVWSVDVPSGIDAEACVAQSGAIAAYRTFVIGLDKIAVHHPTLRKFCGHIHFVDLGLETIASERIKKADCYLIRKEWASRMLQSFHSERKEQDHKASHGRLQIVGGFSAFPGAAIISALTAFKAGCGYVHVHSNAQEKILPAIPEVVFTTANTSSIMANAVVIGPGLGRDHIARKALFDFLNLFPNTSTVLDGDALFFLSAKNGDEEIKQTVFSRSNTILTPHSGEAARILGITAAQVDADRLTAAEKLHELTGAVIVLKGPGTLVIDKAMMTLNPTGNRGMATAGQGDALAGLLGALLADQGAHGLPHFVGNVARLAVYLHGLAGDVCAHELGAQGILAHELALRLPQTMRELLTMKQPPTTS